MTNKEAFLKLVSEEDTETLKEIKERIQKRKNMKQIWKYQVENVIEMPKGAEILTVQVQTPFNTCIWAKVDPEETEMEKRKFEVIGTGHPFDDINKEYVGTYLDGPFVWHLFEIK